MPLKLSKAVIHNRHLCIATRHTWALVKSITVGICNQDFDKLLEALPNLKGKFLLSSYRNARLSEYIEQNGWHSIELKMNCNTEASSVV
ncbi:MAG: hypothetical protein ACRC4W_09560 [Treponemataceae bacterium]